jgi:hypothetical protein
MGVLEVGNEVSLAQRLSRLDLDPTADPAVRVETAAPAPLCGAIFSCHCAARCRRSHAAALSPDGAVLTGIGRLVISLARAGDGHARALAAPRSCWRWMAPAA